MTSEQGSHREPLRDIVNNPEFKAGRLTINVLATSPEGLGVVTDQTLTRRQGIFDIHEPLPIPDDKRKPITEGMRFEVSTALTNAGIVFEEPEQDPMLVKKLTVIQSEVMTPEQIEEYQTKELKARKSVLRRRRIETMTSAEKTHYLIQFARSQKSGIREPWIDEEGNLHVNVVSVPFPFYRHIGNPSIHSPESLLLADVAATAMILKTSDNYLVIQHRSPTKNAAYGGTPGASAAGLLEGTHNRRSTPGTLKPINTDSVINNGAIEASQELGVKKNHDRLRKIDTRVITDFAIEKAASETGEDPVDIRRVRITGLATDNRKYHHEFLLYGELRHTAKELLEEARKAKQAKKGKDFDPVDFEEQFFFIPATIEAIETLLTEFKCPPPDTHSDSLIGAGYMMILEAQGLEAATRWKEGIADPIARNIAEIDEMVRQFHKDHPEVARDNPEIDTNGYDPNFLPEFQGLPSLYDELEKRNIEVEIEKTVGSSYIFDVDGVITDIEERRVTKEEMFDEIIRRLEVSPISFNTGRSLEWVVENVLDPLKEHIQSQQKNPIMLSNLFITAESGGVWATIDHKGNADKHIDNDLRIPEELAIEAQQLLDNKYSYVVANMDPKTTMLTAEKNRGFDQTEFDEEKLRIKADLEALVSFHGLSELVVVDATGIAVDVRSRESGKNVGTRKFLDWLKDKKIDVRTFYTFGDSESDIEMAEELERQGQIVIHKHFGNKLTPEQKARHPKVKIEEPTMRFSDAVLHDLQKTEI